MKNIQNILGLTLLCASLTLVGCGGGGGGDNAQNNEDTQVETTPEEVVEATEEEQGTEEQGDDTLALHGEPDEEVVEENNPVVDVELIQPVEEVAVVPSDLDEPGAIAANPEPTTLALGALGAVFLASRRYRRKA